MLLIPTGHCQSFSELSFSRPWRAHIIYPHVLHLHIWEWMQRNLGTCKVLATPHWHVFHATQGASLNISAPFLPSQKCTDRVEAAWRSQATAVSIYSGHGLKPGLLCTTVVCNDHRYSISHLYLPLRRIFVMQQGDLVGVRRWQQTASFPAPYSASIFLR